MKGKIEGVCDALQKLNLLLPARHQLEKLSFNGESDTTVGHTHVQECPKQLNGLQYPTSGVASLQGRRPTMEDTHVAIDCLSNVFPEAAETHAEHCGFWAVYDGHGGTDTAILAERLLHHSLFASSEFAAGNFTQAVEEAYITTDRIICEKSQEEKWRNGSTAVSVLQVGRKLFIGNAGDSEAVLGKRINRDTSNLEYEGILLTKKHTPSDPSERARIERAGGTVFHGRVLGSLAVSRALGDLNFKDIPMVIPAPFQREVDLSDEDEFLIVACDGLWDVMTYQEAVSYIAGRRQIDSPSALQVSRELCEDAIAKRGSSDNVTVIVVYLRPQYP
jgi:serine/threonine protein phosphatase PrpC